MKEVGEKEEKPGAEALETERPTAGAGGERTAAEALSGALARSRKAFARGDLAGACQALREAVTLAPERAEVHNNLAIGLLGQGRLDEAEESARRALELKGDFAPALNTLANVLRERGDFREAIETFRRAVAIGPDLVDAHSNLGNILLEVGEVEEAFGPLRRALTIQPDSPEALRNLGYAHYLCGGVDEFLALTERAIRFRPDDVGLRVNRAMALLLNGDYQNGWAAYEWRLKWTNHPNFPQHPITKPRWDGSDLAGRSILLHWEQGFGDTIQFARYAPMVKSRGGRVILECRPALARLLRRMEGVDEVVAYGEPLPEFDVYCPLLSLPLLFGTRRESIPGAAGYIRPDPADVAAWARRLGEANRLRVGLVWGGKVTNRVDPRRSLSVRQLAPLLGVGGVSFHSLQVGQRAGELSQLAAGAVADLSPHLSDFGDTAAAMMHLDLVISVDTAAAHLAGAIGRPVWTLLSVAVDWRWGRDAQRTPWYPTMRLFRQSSRGDWDRVVGSLARALDDWARGRRPTEGSMRGALE